MFSLTIRKIFSPIITVLSIGAVAYIMSKYDLQAIKNIRFVDYVYSTFFALIIYTLSGIQYYYVRKNFGVTFKKIDILLFPIVQNLWSILIPFQGSLIFSTFFFKKRYGISISDSFSIGIYIYLFTIVLTGIIGILVYISLPVSNIYILTISVLFILSPLYIWLGYWALKMRLKPSHTITQKVFNKLEKVITQTLILGSKKQLTGQIFLLNILRKLVTAAWFYWIATLFELELSFLSVMFISLLLDISIAIKITPDNLGVAQLISGFSALLLGSNMEDGVLLSLFSSVTSLILVATIGVYGNFHFFYKKN